MAQTNYTAIAAGSIATPAAGIGSVYVDATTKRVASKNDAGTVSDYADLTSTQTLAGKTLTTPNIGAATGTSLAVTAGITTSSATSAGIGYATGAGGAVTQATSKATAFTLSRLTGTITFAADALASQTSVASTWTNTTIAANDVVVFTHSSGGTLGAYNIACTPAAGSATINLRNTSGGSLSEAPVFRFAIIKSVVA
jgi:fermentation-respiration switch protein FrsA (DUF1100 family)